MLEGLIHIIFLRTHALTQSVTTDANSRLEIVFCPVLCDKSLEPSLSEIHDTAVWWAYSSLSEHIQGAVLPDKIHANGLKCVICCIASVPLESSSVLTLLFFSFFWLPFPSLANSFAFTSAKVIICMTMIHLFGTILFTCLVETLWYILEREEEDQLFSNIHWALTRHGSAPYIVRKSCAGILKMTLSLFLEKVQQWY